MQRPNPETKAWTASLLVLALLTLALVGLGSAPASAGEPTQAPGQSASLTQRTQVRTAPPSVVFLGDSVTAGFGYCGQHENAPNISCGVNQEFANSWYFGDNSLHDCNPPATGNPDDRCSDNNNNGAPWNSGPWVAGPGAPSVAYSYQIAAKQNPQAAAPVENWAITGSTPANWDPNGGAFGGQLSKLHDQYVVMTLGANPLLASFLKIRVSGYPATTGVCADSTEWLGWTGWWAYPVSHVIDCAEQVWLQEQQTAHLVNIYRTLLANNNHVMVLGYYTSCPWSFGIWQPNGNVVKGPAAGNSCPSQNSKVDAPGKPVVSQWDQAVGVLNAMNAKIEAAVSSAQQWANSQPAANGANLQFALPNQGQWAKHQGWDADSWIFKNDTWIHPSAAGHAQLANTVTNEMCKDFGQWCGTQPTWVSGLQLTAGLSKQKIKGSPPKRLPLKGSVTLPGITKQGQTIGWTASPGKRCQVHEGKLVAGNKTGPCRLVARAIASRSFTSLKQVFEVAIVRASA